MHAAGERRDKRIGGIGRLENPLPVTRLRSRHRCLLDAGEHGSSSGRQAYTRGPSEEIRRANETGDCHVQLARYSVRDSSATDAGDLGDIRQVAHRRLRQLPYPPARRSRLPSASRILRWPAGLRLAPPQLFRSYSPLAVTLRSSTAAKLSLLVLPHLPFWIDPGP